MRDATVEERLAALRSVREESSRNPGSGTAEADEQRRRSRLSTRLRERLRIGTPASGTPVSGTPFSSTPAGDSPATPATPSGGPPAGGTAS